MVSYIYIRISRAKYGLRGERPLTLRIQRLPGGDGAEGGLTDTGTVNPPHPALRCRCYSGNGRPFVSGAIQMTTMPSKYTRVIVAPARA